MVSELRYPETVSRFRCPVCDTINDLKPHIRHQIGNQPLTLKYLKRCAAKCAVQEKAARRKGKLSAAEDQEERDLDEKEREKFYEPVEKLVETVFSSWVCLNHSFLNVRSLLARMVNIA